jgi:hypothetical protein
MPAKIQIKIFDVLMGLGEDGGCVMVSFFSPNQLPPEDPRAMLRGINLLLRRRPDEVLLFKLSKEAARRVAEAGYVLFAEAGPQQHRDYPVILGKVDLPQGDRPPAVPPLSNVRPRRGRTIKRD